MEKSLKTVDIVIKAQDEGSIVFEIKEPKRINRAVFSDLRREISEQAKESVVIYPEQKFIDSQRVIIETKTSVI